MRDFQVPDDVLQALSHVEGMLGGNAGRLPVPMQRQLLDVHNDLMRICQRIGREESVRVLRVSPDVAHPGGSEIRA